MELRSDRVCGDRDCPNLLIPELPSWEYLRQLRLLASFSWVGGVAGGRRTGDLSDIGNSFLSVIPSFIDF